MNPIVVKFGGSSLATAGQFEKVAAIIRPPLCCRLRAGQAL